MRKMVHSSATAIASPNIALIKYWGNRDDALRLPSNGSISMTMGGLETRTTVTFDEDLQVDQVTIDGQQARNASSLRVTNHLNVIRHLTNLTSKALVDSYSNFPADAGLASSASAFAALSLAASIAAGLELDRKALSRLARVGSGSASRSIFGGFVEWMPGEKDEDSFAKPIAPPDHWELIDLIAIVSKGHKLVSSTEGHALAKTSPLQEARVADAQRRLEGCRNALLTRDFDALARIVEEDSNLMHAVMITSNPSLIYWSSATVTIMQAVPTWRAEGLEVCYTIDAGPNVHCICTAEAANEVKGRLEIIPDVLEVISCPPGHEAHQVDD
jgi:diphosphomevalonate decarboxylase